MSKVSNGINVFADAKAFIVTVVGQELDELRLNEHNIELVYVSQDRGALEFEVHTDAGIERWEARLTFLRRIP